MIEQQYCFEYEDLRPRFTPHRLSGVSKAITFRTFSSNCYYGAGVAIFAKAFMASCPTSGKNYATAYASRPSLPASLVAYQQGYATSLSQWLDAIRKACIFTTQKTLLKTHALSLLGLLDSVRQAKSFILARWSPCWNSKEWIHKPTANSIECCVPRNVVNGYDCGKREQRSDEAYTETMQSQDMHIPEAVLASLVVSKQMATSWG